MFLDQPDKSSAQRNKQKQQHKERPSVVVLDEGQVGASYVPSLSSITAKIAMANMCPRSRLPRHHDGTGTHPPLSPPGLAQKEHGEIYSIIACT